MPFPISYILVVLLVMTLHIGKPSFEGFRQECRIDPAWDIQLEITLCKAYMFDGMIYGVPGYLMEVV